MLGSRRHGRTAHSPTNPTAPRRRTVNVVEQRSQPPRVPRRIDRNPEADRLDHESSLHVQVRTAFGPRGTGATTPRSQRHRLTERRPPTALGDPKCGSSHHPGVDRVHRHVTPVVGRYVLEIADHAVGAQRASRISVTEPDLALLREAAASVCKCDELDHLTNLLSDCCSLATPVGRARSALRGPRTASTKRPTGARDDRDGPVKQSAPA